jgi:hypothetical protein
MCMVAAISSVVKTKEVDLERLASEASAGLGGRRPPKITQYGDLGYGGLVGRSLLRSPLSDPMSLCNSSWLFYLANFLVMTAPTFLLGIAFCWCTETCWERFSFEVLDCKGQSHRIF